MAPERKPRPTLDERFWSKVNKDGPVPSHAPHLGPCWVFTGGRTRGGYGSFLLDPVAKRTARANRVALELHLGRPLGDGMHALHHCDNPACCNPSHLWEGTNHQNVLDREAKGRGNRFKPKPKAKPKVRQHRRAA